MNSLDIRHHYAPTMPMRAIVKELRDKGYRLSNNPKTWFIAYRVMQ